MKDALADHRLSLERIEEAATVIDPVFLHSPQFENEPLSKVLGCDLTLKVETNNPIRSFKGRGADFFLTKISERGDERELVCASTGNFGQAMAYACRKHDRRLIVYADRNANELKLGRIDSLGAVVRRLGDDFDAAKAAAKDYCEEAGAWMIEDGHEPEISEGAGSIAVELFADRSFDTLLVPVGNGALITGVARWAKHVSPNTKVVGVSALGADAMERSWREDAVLESPSADTIAEGIAVRVPVPAAVDDMQGIVDDMVLVDDGLMVDAMKLLQREAGLLVEPAGAVGMAAVLDSPHLYSDRKVVTVLTGNNLTPGQIRSWLC